MRLCLELGLHRPKPFQTHQTRSEQQRRKLFWSVYVFERKSALVLGRPFAVSDKDIVISLPDDDSQEDGSIGSASSTALLRNHVLIYQIHSKMRSTLHYLRSEAPSVRLADKVASCLRKLEDWKARILQEVESRTADTTSASRPAQIHSHSDSSDSAEDEPVLLKRGPDQDKTELLLEYHKARRSLLQPLLTNGGSQYSPTLSDYSACADASGQICRHYRLLHRLSALPFTLRDLHAVLIAGFTWLHCIAARPVLYNAHNVSTIGACSTVLYIIAEQWSGARRYRDTFETVADKLIAKVCETRVEPPDESREPLGTAGNVFTRTNSSLKSQGAHAGLCKSSAPSRSTALPFTEASHSSAPGTTLLSGNTVPFRDPTTLNGGGEYDLNNMFGNIVEESFTSFDMDYADNSLRELLANEGLDWFSKGS
jgi:hypothetical protein